MNYLVSYTIFDGLDVTYKDGIIEEPDINKIKKELNLKY